MKSPPDYFTFYELPVAPLQDPAEIKRKYYANSRKYHPDFHTLASEEEQARILEMSTLNNEAYKTLSDDHLRLKYLLDLKGALAEEGQNKVPQDFLMEVMDINEALMELEFGDDPELRTKARKMTEDLQRELETAARPLLENYDDNTVTDDELKGLADYYLKQRYLRRIAQKM